MYTCTAVHNTHPRSMDCSVLSTASRLLQVFYITRECSALWGEPERATEVCCRLSSTVENGALSLIFRRTRSFAWCRDSVIGERFEVYVRA